MDDHMSAQRRASSDAGAGVHDRIGTQGASLAKGGPGVYDCVGLERHTVANLNAFAQQQAGRARVGSHSREVYASSVRRSACTIRSTSCSKVTDDSQPS